MGEFQQYKQSFSNLSFASKSTPNNVRLYNFFTFECFLDKVDFNSSTKLHVTSSDSFPSSCDALDFISYAPTKAVKRSAKLFPYTEWLVDFYSLLSWGLQPETDFKEVYFQHQFQCI